MTSRLIKSVPYSITITVSELIEALRQYPDNLPVAYLWEGQVTPVVVSEIKVHEENSLSDVYGPVLLMNAET